METPEAKLLALIQSRREACPGGGAKRGLTKLQRLLKTLTRGTPEQHISRALLLALCVTVPGALWAWVKALWGNPSPTMIETNTEADSGAADAQPTGLRLLISRDLFGLPAPTRTPKAAAPPVVSVPPTPPRPPLARRLAHIRLVGILSGPQPQAILDDSQQGTTRYVAAGDALGAARVVRVDKDRVVIAEDGEWLELTL